MTSTSMEHAMRLPRHGRSGTPSLDAVPTVTVEELLGAFSLALDLAEGRAKGHAQRVCFIATSLAGEMGLPRSQRTAAYFVGLLHDIGVPYASEPISNLARGYEQEVFAAAPLQTQEVLAARFGHDRPGVIIDALREHTFAGAAAAANLGMPPPVAEGILSHHERHDGHGFPLGLSGNDVPVVAQVVAVADYAEALLAAEANPLLARRRLDAALREQAGHAFHPRVVAAMGALARRDSFWLGLHNQALPDLLRDMSGQEPRPIAEEVLLRTAAAFSEVADAKNGYKRGHSRRVARFVRALAEALELSPGQVRAVELAALLHDIGMLRVPSRIIGKPEILSVEEMSMLHEHPQEAAEIVRTIPTWEPIAAWIAAHHERPDGRGYPDRLVGEQIPLEARILALADIYEALTADRPHRPAMQPREALAALRGMTGTSIDPALFAAFAAVGPDAREEIMHGV